MSMLSEEQFKRLQTREFVEFLHQHTASQQTNFLQDIYALRQTGAELAAFQVYHALVWMFETYPSIVSIRPVWLTDLPDDPEWEKFKNHLLESGQTEQSLKTYRNNDNMYLTRFRLEIKSLEDGVVCESFYGYDDPPASFVEHGQEVYDTAIEWGENVSHEIWNEFMHYELVRETPYTSAAEVVADFQEDVKELSAAVTEWVLERSLGSGEPKRGGPRF